MVTQYQNIKSVITMRGYQVYFIISQETYEQKMLDMYMSFKTIHFLRKI